MNSGSLKLVLTSSHTASHLELKLQSGLFVLSDPDGLAVNQGVSDFLIC